MPSTYKDLDPILFRREFHNANLLKIIKKAAGTIGDMTNKNQEVLSAKALAYERMLIMLTFGVLSFMGAFVVLAISVIIN